MLTRGTWDRIIYLMTARWSVSGIFSVKMFLTLFRQVDKSKGPFEFYHNRTVSYIDVSIVHYILRVKILVYCMTLGAFYKFSGVTPIFSSIERGAIRENVFIGDLGVTQKFKLKVSDNRMARKIMVMHGVAR